MGLTLWGLIAFGLLTVFLFVGYQAAVRLRSPSLTYGNSTPKHSSDKPKNHEA